MTPPKDVDNLLEAYFSGDTSPEVIEALENWLREDPAHPRILAEYGLVDRLLGCEQKKLDASAIYSLLLEDEAAAQPIVADRPSDEEPAAAARRRSDAIPLREFCSVAGYVAMRGMRSRAGVISLVAAVLLIGVLLFVQFVGPANTPTDGEIASPSANALAVTVATLTAQHDARWSGAERTIGDELVAGQTLTLTDGFAQITTHSGAVVILDAPCAIEMVDSPNAMRLLAGKLVGICETESSKGFTVRTPHMDVTDLGTRFGVDTSDHFRTVVHVIDGKVEVAWQARAGAGMQYEEVVAGHAIEADISGVAQSVQYKPEGFVADIAIEILRPGFADSNAVWLGQLSGDLSQDEREADALQVFFERQGLVLEQGVAVDFNADQAWDPQGRTGLHQVVAGERVDVYLLHFDLANGHTKPEDLVVDFGRPILGVIVSQASLDKTDAALGAAGVTYPVFIKDPLKTESDLSKSGYGPRGLNHRAIELLNGLDEIEFKNDLATISTDGTKLELRLWGGEVGAYAKMDQVRVLVRAQEIEDN